MFTTSTASSRGACIQPVLQQRQKHGESPPIAQQHQHGGKNRKRQTEHPMTAAAATKQKQNSPPENTDTINSSSSSAYQPKAMYQQTRSTGHHQYLGVRFWFSTLPLLVMPNRANPTQTPARAYAKVSSNTRRRYCGVNLHVPRPRVRIPQHARKPGPAGQEVPGEGRHGPRNLAGHTTGTLSSTNDLNYGIASGRLSRPVSLSASPRLRTATAPLQDVFRDVGAGLQLVVDGGTAADDVALADDRRVGS
ncbi:unnamed protein product [Ectocarpus sp. 4 AP-2014]